MSSTTRGAALVAAICALTCANASAATFAVDKTADDAGGGACTGAANDCSLRSAIQDANANAGSDTITLAAGTYNVSTGDEQTITQGVTITGAGARSTAIDGGGVVQTLLDLNTGDPVNVSDLTVRGSAAGDFVSAVLVVNALPLTLSRVALVDNAAIPLNVQGGMVAVSSSVIAHNSAGAVGAIGNAGSSVILTVRDSTIAQNTALPASDTQPVAFTGGILNGGGATIINSTIAGNRIAPTASALGGDNLETINAGNTLGLIRVANSIVADASANGNCGGPIETAGHNLDSDGTCGFHATTDRPGVDPLLGALGDNGGPTDTRALPANSPAVDAGAGCGPTDQRGVARPAGGACDIGAFESPFTAPVPAPPAPPPVVTPVADTTPATLTVSGIKKTVTRKAFNKGLKVKIGANEPIAAELTLLATPHKVTIARLANLVLATKSLARAGGTRTVTLKPSPKVTGKRAVKMRLIVVAFDAAGNRSSKTVAFTVK